MEYLETAALVEKADWDTEYLDYILAIKVVDSLDEAITHINQHNTKHSETIVTDSYQASQRFLNEVDAAAVDVMPLLASLIALFLALAQKLGFPRKSYMLEALWV